MTRFTAQLTTQLDRLGHGNCPGGRPGSRHDARRSGRDRPPTLVAVAHGSRDPEALRTVTALLDRVRALRPGLPVRLGHIELNQPLLTDTLAALRGEAVLVPLLLSRGHHTKQDIPDAVAAAPHLAVRIAAPLGPDPLLAEALHARLAEAGHRAGVPHGVGTTAPYGTGAAAAYGAGIAEVAAACGVGVAGVAAPHGVGVAGVAAACGAGVPAPHRAGVVLAAAGSRDPDAAVDVARTAALLSARLGGVPVLPGYASGSGPTVPEAVRALAALGHDRIAVASYFTAPGRFATQCAHAAERANATPGAHAAQCAHAAERASAAQCAHAAQGTSAAQCASATPGAHATQCPHAAPRIAAAPLGAHPAVARLILRRYEQTLAFAPLSPPAATVGV
ncbi:sirohydrochlorin chelatase [Streptomyces sp. NPDC059474]|uniref:sirohydrochlorin chelatase n=1 Tax=Streptomyces sp. NPDC059474 TaxID=3346846 RepID=UPI0036CDC1E0